jgi:predicted Holliday junction resolvase-like endonuclease
LPFRIYFKREFQTLFFIYTYISRFGVRREDLPKYEEELELKIAKAQLEELKKDAVEAMETQRKRYFVVFMLSFDYEPRGSRYAGFLLLSSVGQ